MAARAETVIMFMYSAMKNMANRIEEYSVWKPPTSSPSASGRSNGRPVGLPHHRDQVDHERREQLHANQSGMSPEDGERGSACSATISEVDSDPA